VPLIEEPGDVPAAAARKHRPGAVPVRRRRGRPCSGASTGAASPWRFQRSRSRNPTLRVSRQTLPHSRCRA
jgi:hypothetical protein